jgi:hypothetical protein
MRVEELEGLLREKDEALMHLDSERELAIQEKDDALVRLERFSDDPSYLASLDYEVLIPFPIFIPFYLPEYKNRI